MHPIAIPEGLTNKLYKKELSKVIKHNMAAITFSPVIAVPIIFLFLYKSGVNLNQEILHNSATTILILIRDVVQFYYELIIKGQALFVGLLAIEFIYYQSYKNDGYIKKHRWWMIWGQYIILFMLLTFIYYDKLL